MKSGFLNVIFRVLLTTLSLTAVTAQADEGMWLFNKFPTEIVKQKYGFTATPEWLDHARLSSARLAGGCSGSFVSSNGLVLTNHHCASSCIEQLSTPSKDFIETGFYAKTQGDEIKCPEIEINRLVSMTDVTARINKATDKLEGKAFNDKLKSELATIEKECSAGNDLSRCEVVSLFQGGKYHLYQYQRYQDVRLVFAPEMAIAFFGGDPDNFNFPRYDLDMAMLRVYENDKPLVNTHYFQWSKTPAKEGDLSFVTGHPGGTSRLLTVDQLKFVRDEQLMYRLLNLAELRGVLTEFQKRGAEQKRISTSLLFGIENSYKGMYGRLKALQDEKFFDSKIAAEKKLIAAVNAKPNLKKQYGSAWTEIADSLTELRKIFKGLNNTENTNFGTRYFTIARTLVRSATELKKENGVRMREYRDSALPELKQGLFSTAPIYNELETTLMTYSLTKTRERLGADDPFVKALLGQQSPEEIAQKMISKTKLGDVALRKKLFEGGLEAIQASDDPFIKMALLVDPYARELRTRYEDTIETRIKKNSEKIGKARFAVYGDKNYPDATFTLRVSYGQIKGYEENGHTVAPITQFKGGFERHTGRDPYKLPDTWLNAKSKVDMTTPFNFCSTNDIIGGNSGSPVINKDAEVIGLIFDGNIQSLGGDYGFDERVNRAVAVHSQAIVEALKNVYGAQRVVDDLFKK